jgi:hypothetical protein
MRARARRKTPMRVTRMNRADLVLRVPPEVVLAI